MDIWYDPFFIVILPGNPEPNIFISSKDIFWESMYIPMCMFIYVYKCVRTCSMYYASQCIWSADIGYHLDVLLTYSLYYMIANIVIRLTISSDIQHFKHMSMNKSIIDPIYQFYILCRIYFDASQGRTSDDCYDQEIIW